MAILVVIDDLLFRSKIETSAAAAGVKVYWAVGPKEVMRALTGSWETAIVDLSAASTHPVESVRALRKTFPDLPIIGYCSHVQTSLQQQAKAAGASAVWPRSVFVENLPDLLNGRMPKAGAI